MSRIPHDREAKDSGLATREAATQDTAGSQAGRLKVRRSGLEGLGIGKPRDQGGLEIRRTRD